MLRFVFQLFRMGCGAALVILVGIIIGGSIVVLWKDKVVGVLEQPAEPRPSGTPFVGSTSSNAIERPTPTVAQAEDSSLFAAELYFKALSVQDWDTAWRLVSDELKQEKDLTRESFIQFWSTYPQVSFEVHQSLETGGSDGQHVEAQATGTLKVANANEILIDGPVIIYLVNHGDGWHVRDLDWSRG